MIVIEKPSLRKGFIKKIKTNTFRVNNSKLWEKREIKIIKTNIINVQAGWNK